MTFPRTEGAYLLVDESRRVVVYTDHPTAIRFFDNRTVLTALSGTHVDFETRMVPKAVTKSVTFGVPAPVVVSGDRIEWVRQVGFSQDSFEGRWTPESLELEVRGELGTSHLRYEHFSTETIVKEQYDKAPRPNAPPDEPPAGAADAWGTPFTRIAGEGAPLGRRDIVGCRFVDWSSGSPAFSYRESLVENVLGGAPERVGDVLRVWWSRGGKTVVEDITVTKHIQKPLTPRDGLYVGPIVDGHRIVIRIVDMATLKPIYMVAARMAADKLKPMMKWGNIGSVKDLFAMPAEASLADGKIRWVSQIFMDEQIVFEGSYSDDELVLTEEHRVAESDVRRCEHVPYRFVPTAELPALEKEAKKASPKLSKL